jgi:hypothetical protein
MYQRGVDLPAGMERPMGFQRKHACISFLPHERTVRSHCPHTLAPRTHVLLAPSSPPFTSIRAIAPLHCSCHQQGLAGVSMLLVNQKVEYMEALTGFETANQYTVLNEHGHPTFHAAEVSNWVSRNFLGKNRPFTLNVVNPDGSLFLVIDRVRPPHLAPCYVRCPATVYLCPSAHERNQPARACMSSSSILLSAFHSIASSPH